MSDVYVPDWNETLDFAKKRLHLYNKINGSYFNGKPVDADAVMLIVKPCVDADCRLPHYTFCWWFLDD